jgi:hypothetical protein
VRGDEAGAERNQRQGDSQPISTIGSDPRADRALTAPAVRRRRQQAIVPPMTVISRVARGSSIARTGVASHPESISRVLRHGVGEDTVEADRREQCGEGGNAVDSTLQRIENTFSSLPLGQRPSFRSAGSRRAGDDPGTAATSVPGSDDHVVAERAKLDWSAIRTENSGGIRL